MKKAEQVCSVQWQGSGPLWKKTVNWFDFFFFIWHIYCLGLLKNWIIISWHWRRWQWAQTQGCVVKLRSTDLSVLLGFWLISPRVIHTFLDLDFFFFCKMINGTSQKCCFTAIFSSVNLSHIPKFLRPKETLALSSLSSSLCYWGSGMYKSLHFFSDVLKINPKVMWPHSALWTRRYCCFLKSSSLWNCYSIFFYFETKVWFFALTDRPPCTFRHHVVAVVLDPSP